MKKRRAVFRPLTTLLIVLLSFSQVGCLTKPPPLELHEQLLTQRIALVPDRSVTQVSLELFARSKPEGALRGAGHGIVTMLSEIRPGSCSGDMCGAALLLYLALSVTVGGTIGAVQGALESASAKSATAVENFVKRHLQTLASHIDLARRIILRSGAVADLSLELVRLPGPGPGVSEEEIRSLQNRGYQKVMTVKLERLDFVGGKGEDPRLGLYLEAQVRMIDVDRGEVDYQRNFSALGATRRYSEWRESQPAALSAEFDACLDQLAQNIVTGFFLAYDLPVASGSWAFPGTKDYGCCWICPVEPALELDFLPVISQNWPVVPSPQPRLQWQPFPGESRQGQLLKHVGNRATHVRYDLRIWKAAAGPPEQPVYERYALDASSHRVEDPLEPQTRYLWSVRACFALGERQACTPWAFSLIPAGPDGCESIDVGPENYYRFRTP